MLHSQPPFNNNYSLTDPTQDSRINEFFTFYFDNKSPDTYLNITSSALKAEFSPQEADQITKQNWFLSGSSQFRRKLQNDKADRNLEEFLDLDTKELTFTKDGTPIESHNPALVNAKLKTTLFVKERLDKDNFSQRIDKNETLTVNIFKALQEIEQGNLSSLIPKDADVVIDNPEQIINSNNV